MQQTTFADRYVAEMDRSLCLAARPTEPNPLKLN
jgi:hypothetical protein